MYNYESHDIILFSVAIIDKEGYAFRFAISYIFVVKKEGSHGCVEPSSNPKCMRETAIVDSSIHMTTRKFLLLQCMCSHSQPCLSIIQYFIEKEGVTYKGTTFNTSC